MGHVAHGDAAPQAELVCVPEAMGLKPPIPCQTGHVEQARLTGIEEQCAAPPMGHCGKGTRREAPLDRDAHETDGDDDEKDAHAAPTRRPTRRSSAPTDTAQHRSDGEEKEAHVLHNPREGLKHSPRRTAGEVTHDEVVLTTAS